MNERDELNPTYILFENYVLDTIGALTPEKLAHLQALDIQGRFGTKACAWREAVHEFLGLSQTIDIAIRDLWFQNVDKAAEEGWAFTPEEFAVNFVDEYYREGSKIDVWAGDALEVAQRFVAERNARKPQ